MMAGFTPSLVVDVTGTQSPGRLTPTAPHAPTNIFVARIPASWTEETLIEKYRTFGEIISAKVVPRRHFGFVMFRTPEAAHAAINATHQTRPHPHSSTLLHVSIAMHDEGSDDIPNDRLFIRGLPQWTTKEHLQKCFSPFGTVVQADVLVNYQGQCKGSGFVQFSTVDEATAALQSQGTIRVPNWDSPLEVKYSETTEAHQQRQERNRSRQKLWSNSPKYSPMVSPGVLPPSPQVFHNPIPITPPSYVILPYYPPPPTSGHPPSPSSLPPQVTPSVYLIPTAPQSGDLSFMAPNITMMTVGALLQQFGQVEKIYTPGQEHTIAARMADSSNHAFIAQTLNGAVLATGEILVVGLYS